MITLRRWKEHLDVRAGIAAFAVLVIAINAIILMGVARKEKHGVLQSAALSNAREATGFEQYASRTIGLADTATRFLAREFRSSGASIDLAHMFADGTIDPQLFGAATIIAPDGTALASSEAHPDAARFENLRHQDFVAPPADGGGLQVGQPIPASGGRGQMIPFFRRLDLPGAGFAGFVVLEMAPAHFLAFDDKAAPRSEVIALIGLDRIVRARRAGHIFTSGENVPDAIQFQSGGLLTGDLVATSPIDNIRRLFHIRQVPGYPLHVVAGIRQADALAEVSARANSYYARTLVLSGVILVLAVSVIGALTRGKRAFAQLRVSEAASRAHERELSTLMESMPQLVWITEPDGTHSYFNQQWVDYTGLSVAQSVGSGWKAAFDPTEQESVIDRWRDAVAEQKLYETEYRLRGADSEYRWMLGRAIPLRNATGTILKWFGTCTDIHDLKAAELEISRAYRELRESEERFSGAFEHAPVGVALVSSDDRLFKVNRAFCNLLGFSEAELLTRTFHDLTDTMNHAPSRENLRRLCVGEIHSFEMEKHYHHRNGHLITALTTVSRVRDGQGQLSYFIAQVQDITERKRVEAELQKTHAELVTASRQAGMSEVATSVLHNVGNVLNSVNISCSVVADRVRKSRIGSVTKTAALLHAHADDLAGFLSMDPTGKRLPQYIGKLAEQLSAEQAEVLRELKLLGNNIDHIKEIVAMQQNYGRVSGITESIRITDLVEDSLRMIEEALARNGVRVVREYDEVPPVTLEKHKALQILVNLVRNAKQACRDSGRDDKQLTVRVAAGHDCVRVSVIDNGVGIPPENLTRIFAHGFTTKAQGHGFGLHSGALAAAEIGGSLTVYSDGSGTGATFTLELPSQSDSGK